MAVPDVLIEACAHWVNTRLSGSLCVHLHMCLSRHIANLNNTHTPPRTDNVIVFCFLECLPFIKCCSGAERTIDKASVEMTGIVSDHVCIPAHMYIEGESPRSGVRGQGITR